MQLDLARAFTFLRGARWGAAHGASVLAASGVVTGVSTDSRAITPGCLFVALKGERFDAHAFVEQAVRDGASAVLVNAGQSSLALGVPQIEVPDTTHALGELAKGWRCGFRLPVIAVTGSNGKTTVKAMIASIFEAAFGAGSFHATPGNLNNAIGVPLTLLGLRPSHRCAVVELGMNHPGEIAGLADMAQPRVTLVNNAQREHQEFMDGVAATAHENGAAIAALPADGIAVFPADDACAPIWRALAGQRRVIDFALSAKADATAGDDVAVSAQTDADPCGFDLTLRGLAAQESGSTTVIRIELAIAGQHNVRNALAAAACCRAIGIAPAAIVAGLAAFRPVAGRLVRQVRADGAVVIDDSYNANPDSVRAAIDLLADLGVGSPGDEGSKTVLVLGDMGEVGSQGEAFHAEVGAWARRRGLGRLIATGDLSRFAVNAWDQIRASPSGAAGFGQSAQHCASIQETISAALGATRPGTTVLVKGSRFMRMERVVHALLQTRAVEAGGHG
jgi:UDP-N-acetylmuramoyl-tripeptide--D-alanyl-D-alanine ligase